VPSTVATPVTPPADGPRAAWQRGGDQCTTTVTAWLQAPCPAVVLMQTRKPHSVSEGRPVIVVRPTGVDVALFQVAHFAHHEHPYRTIVSARHAAS